LGYGTVTKNVRVRGRNVDAPVNVIICVEGTGPVAVAVKVTIGEGVVGIVMVEEGGGTETVYVMVLVEDSMLELVFKGGGATTRDRVSGR
jgi:hypothetical protein